MLGLDRSTLKKLSVDRSAGGIRLKSSLCELFHENTKLTPTSGRVYGQRVAAFLRSATARKLTANPYKTYTLMDQVALAAVEPRGDLERVICERRSVRRFSGEPASPEELARLLFLTYGRTGLRGPGRPIASGGGLYPLELYVTVLNVTGLEPGLYHYNVERHCLDVVRSGDTFGELESCLSLQDIEEPRRAALILNVCAMLPRSTVKYGDRGYRLVLMEAGEAVHNLALLASALGLASCPLGGFVDNALSRYLGIDGVEEVPLVPMVFGRPRKRNGASDAR